MRTVTVVINTAKIGDGDSFHAEFAKMMGFPDSYGRNADAWIDCMSDLGDPDTGMTKFSVAADEICIIEVLFSEDFSRRLPDIFSALVGGTAAVNQRAKAAGRSPLLALAFS